MNNQQFFIYDEKKMSERQKIVLEKLVSTSVFPYQTNVFIPLPNNSTDCKNISMKRLQKNYENLFKNNAYNTTYGISLNGNKCKISKLEIYKPPIPQSNPKKHRILLYLINRTTKKIDGFIESSLENRGNVLYIDFVRVSPRTRGGGLCTKMISRLADYITDNFPKIRAIHLVDATPKNKLAGEYKTVGDKCYTRTLESKGFEAVLKRFNPVRYKHFVKRNMPQSLKNVFIKYFTLEKKRNIKQKKQLIAEMNNSPTNENLLALAYATSPRRNFSSATRKVSRSADLKTPNKNRNNMEEGRSIKKSRSAPTPKKNSA